MLHKRVLEVLRTTLRQDEFSRTLATTLPRAGLDAVEADLRQLATSVLTVSRLNRQIFAPFYDDILARLA